MSGEEADLVSACVGYVATYYLGRAYLEPIGQRRARGSGTAIGAPDAILSFDGRLIPIEFKSADGKLRPGQVLARRCRADAGVETHVVRTLQEFADLLRPQRSGVRRRA